MEGFTDNEEVVKDHFHPLPPAKTVKTRTLLLALDKCMLKILLSSLPNEETSKS